MATIPTKPDLATRTPLSAASLPAWPQGSSANISTGRPGQEDSGNGHSSQDDAEQKPSQRDALQALLAFSALHEQVRRRKALAARHQAFDAGAAAAEFEEGERFVLDEVLQLVAERAVAITGADGLAIALAENSEIVLRASAGSVRPDVGARIDRDSAFSGASFRLAQIVNCDDTETDARVNLQACRRLGARSMVAVPLCGRRRVIGLLEAFSSWPFGFNDSDVRNLSLLAELVVSALKPEDEDRFADSAQVAAAKLVESRPAPLPASNLPPVTVRVQTVVPVVEPKPHEAPVSAAPVQVSSTPAPIVEEPSEAVSAPAPETPVETAQEPANIAEFEALAAAERAAEPELNLLREPDQETRKPGMLVLLICIVVAAAFAAGVGLWKTAQLGSMIVRTKPVAPKISDTGTQGTSASPNTATDATSIPGAKASSDTLSDTGSLSSPAAPQDLAKFPRVTGIRHWSSADSSTVVLDLEDQVQYEEHHITNPDRYYYDLRDTQLAPELAGNPIEVGDSFLTRIRIAQPVAGITRVVLETKGGASIAHPNVSLEPNPYRLVIEVRKIGANPKGAVNLFPNAQAEKNRLAIVIPPPTKEDLQLRARVPKMRIVVDAGHGGWDMGTVGRRGLLEKDLVLEITERLGKLLTSRLGADVIYTRQDDNYIPLDERAEIANQSQADLFVSVHANYSDLPSARGVETYYTNTFSAPGSKEAGAKDADAHANASIVKSAVLPALSPADLHERIEQSRRLAASVQRSLYGALSVQNPGLRDRGIKEAGFVVLTESAMPGILAEVSFVSSPTDEQKLRSDGYREQIAEALYKGIARYAAASRSVKVASAGK